MSFCQRFTRALPHACAFGRDLSPARDQAPFAGPKIAYPAVRHGMIDAMRLVVIWCLGLALGAAEVRMADGRVLEGEILDHASDQRTLVLAVTSGRVRAELRLPRDEIVHLDPEPSARERELAAIDAAAAELDAAGSATEWWALAERCRELDPIRFRELAGATLVADRHHPEARTALGFARVNGIWMLDHEAAAAHGLVFHQGRWHPYVEVARLEREEAQRLAQRAAESDERRVRRRSVHRRIEIHSAYDYGRTLVVPGLWPGCYRRLRGGVVDGRSFVPAPGTRALGGVGSAGGERFRLAP